MRKKVLVVSILVILGFIVFFAVRLALSGFVSKQHGIKADRGLYWFFCFGQV